MRGSVPRVSRILSVTLVTAISLGAPGWPQDNPPPPANPPQQGQPPPAKPPGPTPPPKSPEPPPSGQGQTQTPPETAPAPAEVQEPQAPPPKKGATLKGRVLGTDRKSPLAGAIVHALAADNSVISSQPTDPKGHYLLGDLPPGTYTVGVESEGGLYLLEGPLGVNSAQTFNMDLATVPASAATTPLPGIAAPPRGFCYIVQGHLPSGTAFWKSPEGIILLAATAGAVGLILSRSGNNSKEETPVSPSAP